MFVEYLCQQAIVVPIFWEGKRISDVVLALL